MKTVIFKVNGTFFGWRTYFLGTDVISSVFEIVYIYSFSKIYI